MPKLDGTHLPQRLSDRLAVLRSDKEVAARDVKALLNDEQIAAIDEAWNEQQVLRKHKRARTKAEEKELGWKTKREIYIEAYEKALAEANENFGDAITDRRDRSEVKAARTYLDAFFAALDDDKKADQANSVANNQLKRAQLASVKNKRLSPRDEQVWALEEAIRVEIRKNLTIEQLEQLKLLEEQDKAVAKDRTQKS